jgi:hypothetical protein
MEDITGWAREKHPDWTDEQIAMDILECMAIEDLMRCYGKAVKVEVTK